MGDYFINRHNDRSFNNADSPTTAPASFIAHPRPLAIPITYTHSTLHTPVTHPTPNRKSYTHYRRPHCSPIRCQDHCTETPGRREKLGDVIPSSQRGLSSSTPKPPSTSLALPPKLTSQGHVPGTRMGHSSLCRLRRLRRLYQAKIGPPLDPPSPPRASRCQRG